MPELIEQMYCSQQIVIPPKYPYILKRYCKAAIKTQPYDLLRWSFEYFKALAEHRPPPVKLRLEYPIYSTEGGLTRGCLKVLAHQLYDMKEIPIDVLKRAWQGFCLDRVELNRILCLCEVYLRKDSVPFLHFLAVAGGMLTKCLTHTMILLCESLTKEPDGGSAAIPVEEFLSMYRYLAEIDASENVQYHNGYREGFVPQAEHDDEADGSAQTSHEDSNDDEYWAGEENFRRVELINDHVGNTVKLSDKLNQPVIGTIERSPSIERITEIERENYMRERRGKPAPNEEIDKKLKALSQVLMRDGDTGQAEPSAEDTDVDKKGVIDIFVYDEEEQAVTYEIYGEPIDDEDEEMPAIKEVTGEAVEVVIQSEAEKVKAFIAEVLKAREERLNDLEQTFDEIADIVDKSNTASYDLGMVAGRQMSITSGEFIAQHVEKDIMAFIDDQIAILPDPDLKKKKAKPEEVAMIRDILEQFLDDNMDVIVPEIEEVEEEELPIPEITMVYAVPGIGGPVEADVIADFVEYIREVCKVQAGMVMPRNVRHFLCPPLKKYVEQDFQTNDVPMKEEVATEGVITD